MNWKQLLFPRSIRTLYKTVRRTKNKIIPRILTRFLHLGWPRVLTSQIGSRLADAQVVLYKQGILSVVVGNRFLRVASGSSGRKLQTEYIRWRELSDRGLASILAASMDLRTAGSATILETDCLWPIAKEDQLTVTLPIIRELVARARPLAYGMPDAVRAGLEFAKRIAGGSLPSSFVNEEEIRSCFARELLCGPTHQDLHYKNVMRDITGRPVLIDLKSCLINSPVCLDLLTFVCKYRQARDGRNTIEIAYTAQQRGWRFPELEPVLSLIELDRHLWGPVCLIYSMGRWTQKANGGADQPSICSKLLLRVLTRQWQVAAA